MIDVLTYNVQYFFLNMFTYAWSAYESIGVYKYPIVFVAIIGYVYLATKSVMLTILAIFVTYAVYSTTTDIFNDVAPINQLLAIVSMIGVVCFIMGIVLRKAEG
jgi:hypothetical protein